jgi:alpha-2-macroglobulin-like protein
MRWFWSRAVGAVCVFTLLSAQACPQAAKQDNLVDAATVGTADAGLAGGGAGGADGDAPSKPKVILPPVAAEAAPAQSPRLPVKDPEAFDVQLGQYFDGRQLHRIYVQVDKPIYKPGESVWLRAWDVRAKDLTATSNGTARYELVSPKGAVVIKKNVAVSAGYSTNDFELPEDVQGGEYIIRVVGASGSVGERPIIVSTYEPPRVQKKLEFVRKAYGVGDLVTATLELKRPTGEALANQNVAVVARVDGVELARTAARTDVYGAALVKVQMPATIDVGDGLLTVLVDDGGVTESISKAIPLVLRRMQLSFFPEGGTFVSDLESRVYFEAKTPLGKPADVSGDIIDDTGNTVSRFSSHKNGLGRFTLKPALGRTYRARITQPVGISEEIQLPLANKDGCVLRTYDDLDGQREEIPVSVRCTTDQRVGVAGFVREQLIDAAGVDVKAGSASTIYLRGKNTRSNAMGVARVTLFDANNTPIAERVVFRGRRNQLQVNVTGTSKTYSPRDAIELNIETRDTAGKPVAADVALSVVDDAVISFADDKTGHMLSRLFLEPELPEKVEEPNVFFDLKEETSALAMEMLMGTRGYRRFEWAQALMPQRAYAPSATAGARGMREGEAEEFAPADMMEEAPRPKGGANKKVVAKPAPRDLAPPPPAPAAPEGPAVPVPEPAKNAAPVVVAEGRMKAKEAPARARMGAVADKMDMAQEQEVDERRPQQDRDDNAGVDGDWAKAEGKAARRAGKDEAPPEMARQRMAMAPVRVFPAPNYSGPPPAVRSDFRETLHWLPQVKTDSNGKASVKFFASDAVTSLRVFTEGVGGGLAGRQESVLSVKLPFSLVAKLPTEVSSGDRIDLPVTLTNETGNAVDVDLKGTFGNLLRIKGDAGVSKSLQAQGQAGASASSFFALDVVGVQGKTPIALQAAGSGLRDEILRELNVVPRGFPMLQEFSGSVKDKVLQTVNVGETIAGTVDAYVRFYPSPTSTLLAGLEGMLREPSGCFEQTSSTNYPNVMITSYLQRNNIAAPDVQERASKLLQSGYRKLVGFETPQKGYEWFGGAPGHEALTAYGLLEFQDMQGVYDGVDSAMITRTAAWLKARRDGKGGYSRNDRALDSFGGASPEVTNGYITYALSEAKMAGDLQAEIAAQRAVATNTKDAYLLALAVNTLFNVGETAAGKAAARALAAMQAADGSFSKADHSITRSGGENLVTETTALAIMGLIKSGEHKDVIRNAVKWMMEHRSSYGQWGATQATVLALQAFIRYAESTRATQGPGSVIVQINGKVVGNVSYQAGHKDPIVIDGLGKYLRDGANEVKLLVDGKDELPYTMGVEWRASKPNTSEKTVVDLAVKADKSSVKMGEAIRITATLTNKTQQGQPMTIARIGIPGGTNFQVWQLKKLKDDGVVDFWETRAREVIVYFRALAPGAIRTIPIDVIANVAGHYEAPASSAYLYYTDEHKVWTAPLVADIAR